MENNILKIISGDFEGTFSTNQNVEFQSIHDLSSNDSVISIHEGEAFNIKNHSEIDQNQPENFNLNDVRNIQIHPGNDWIYDNKRLFDFKEFTLSNSEIISTWQLNGKTYGKIKGNFIGSVLKKENQTPDKKDPNSDENNPVQPLPNNQTNNSEDSSKSEGNFSSNNSSNNQGNNNSNNQDGSNSASNQSQQNQQPPITPENKNLNPGCLPNIWKWLRWLFLLILLLWLFKKCSSVGSSISCYVKKWKLENKLDDLKTETDTLKNKIEENKIDIEPCAQRKADGINHVDIQYFDLGEQSGKVKIHYDMYNEPDMLEMFYDGELVNSTVRNVKGEGFLTWNYKYTKNKPTNFMLKLIPGPASGTKWIYSLHCPK